MTDGRESVAATGHGGCGAGPRCACWPAWRPRGVRRRAGAGRRGRPGGPPPAGRDGDPRQRAGRADQRVRRHGEVAALDHHPAASRRLHPPHRGALGRTAWRRARCCSRSTPSAQQASVAALQSMRAAREADVGLRQAAGRAHQDAARRRRRSASRKSSRSTRRLRRGRGAAQGARRADPPAAQSSSATTA